MTPATPCKVPWCGALAFHAGYCPVHYADPAFDPRDNYERVVTGETPAPAKRPGPKAPTLPDPVDERGLIQIAKRAGGGALTDAVAA